MAIEIILPLPSVKAAIPVPEKRRVWKALPSMPVVGFIDNSKTRASDILESIGRNLVARGVVESWFMIRKPNAGIGMTDSDRTELLARGADMVVAGVGD